ncbi:PEP-CTERM motif protein [Opitutaceae bacterium TAV1]|nr:PEP-CTERM motif protein [Opitutaceae bacterium TAV1]
MKAKYLFSLLLPAISLCAPLACGALVFEDDFSSGVGNWSLAGSGTLAATPAAGPVSGDPAAAYAIAGSNRGAAYASFDHPVTLLHVGDKITLSFDYKGILYGSSTDNLITFGLGNSMGTAALTDDRTYLAAIRSDQRSGQATSSPTRTYYYPAGAGVDSSTGFTALTTTRTTPNFYLNGGAVTNTTPNIDDTFHFTFTITLLADGLRIDTVFTNTSANPDISFTSTALVGKDDPAFITRFDTVNIGAIRINQFAVDNVLVDYQATPVPEPATVATLLGLGALLACAFLRQRR